MKIFVSVSWVIALFISGCAFPRIDSPEPGDTLTLTVESGIAEAEVVPVLDAWRDRSQGRIDIRIGPNGDAKVTEGDRNSFSRFNRRIQIAADEPNPELMLDHSIGRMLGIQPHLGPGVMSSDDFVRSWTKEDEVSCKNAGWCL